MFNLEIFRHQVLVYHINLIPIILKLVTIGLSFNDEGNKNDNNTKCFEYNYTACYINNNSNYTFNNNNNIININNNGDDNIILKTFKLKNLYVIYKGLAPIGIISYLFLIALRSYANSKLKWYIDLKYLSEYKLLML